MHTTYKSPAMQQLRDQQVRFAPRDKKLQQAAQAEVLIDELEPKRIYPYEYLCYRVTGIRPSEMADLKLTYRDSLHDLQLLIEDLSDAADLQALQVEEQVYTIEELSKRFNVSTKTISRWRKRGLVSRRFLFSGRKRVGFLDSSVRRFQQNHPDQIKRGTRFSQLSKTEKNSIVQHARRLAQLGGRPTEVARKIARQMGRSTETIRYTLKHFDQDHPDIAIFPDSSTPLRDETRDVIYHMYKRGVSPEELADTYCRTRSSIYRIINEVRAQRIMDLPIEYIDSEEFAQRRSSSEEAEIRGPAPPASLPEKGVRLPSGTPPYLARLYDVPLLTREQEVHLFRKMNYLKYLAARLREKLDPVQPKSSLMDEIEKLYDEAVATKNEIVSANLRLVVSIAKRHANEGENFFELVSDGNLSLMRAVEKFDYNRGNKFSTYASWAIIKNYARSIPNEHKQRDRFRPTDSDLFEASIDNRTVQYEQEVAQMERESQVEKILGRLDDREQHIIISRFGLGDDPHPMTLKEVGHNMGVTKERIRQIEMRALSKLRDAAQEEKIEIPGLD